MARKNGYVAEQCELWGIPMMTEMIPPEVLKHQFESRAKRKWPSDPEIIKYSARVAAELGADDASVEDALREIEQAAGEDDEGR